MNLHTDTLAAGTERLQRSVGQLARQGRRMIHDHPSAMAFGALLGAVALAAVVAYALLSRDDGGQGE
jgi:hypothetical protein